MAVSLVTERDVLLVEGIEERVGGKMEKLETEEGGVVEEEVVKVLKDVGEARRMAIMMMDEEGWENKKRKRDDKS
jgi:ATP-dependent RNA helicase DDX49/DBP8